MVHAPNDILGEISLLVKIKHGLDKCCLIGQAEVLVLGVCVVQCGVQKDGSVRQYIGVLRSMKGAWILEDVLMCKAEEDFIDFLTFAWQLETEQEFPQCREEFLSLELMKFCVFFQNLHIEFLRYFSKI